MFEYSQKYWLWAMVVGYVITVNTSVGIKTKLIIINYSYFFSTAKGKKDVNKSKVAVEKTATKATAPKIDQSVCTGGNIFKDGDIHY